MQRPTRLLALGAANDVSSLLGHGFTYEGSQAGFIVETLMETQCMNPILVLDELDKVSSTNRGDEVLRCLLQLTDPLQTGLFRDRYLGTLMPLDLSAALLLFSMNSSDTLIPALLDRLEIISLDSFTREDLKTVILRHLLPGHLKKMDLEASVVPLSHPSMQLAAEQLANAAQQRGLRWVDLLLHKAALRALACTRGCIPATSYRGVVVWIREHTDDVESKLLISEEGLQQIIRAMTPSSPILSYVI
jgi:ATP-dependent Lon protease